VRRPVCLAVEWVAWAVWTINPTLNRNDEGPGFFRASFLVPQPRQIRVLNALWSCAEITQLLVSRHHQAAVDVPAGSTRSYKAGAVSGLTPGRHQSVWRSKNRSVMLARKPPNYRFFFFAKIAFQLSL
jgi:hypothetical protein